jgi:hypothetical protein
MRRLKILGNAYFAAGGRGRIGMQFGHNTNVTVVGTVIHVQTEDRGIANALIDTTVYCRGRVLHRRTNSYFDLLPLDADREQALKLRVDDQHSTVLEELRSGVLQVVPPPAPLPPTPVATNAPPPPAPAAVVRVPGSAQTKAISVELLNQRTWLAGKHATLYLAVRNKDAGAPASGARVTARIEGAAEHAEVSTVTSADGHAQLEFDMPRLGGEEAALAIEALSGEARGHLRFQLRAKPKVPAAR